MPAVGEGRLRQHAPQGSELAPPLALRAGGGHQGFHEQDRLCGGDPTKRAVKVAWHPKELEHLIRILKIARPDWRFVTDLELFYTSGLRIGRRLPNGLYLASRPPAAAGTRFKPRTFNREILQSKFPRRVVAEQGSFPDVLADGGQRPMAGLLHDGQLVSAVQVRLGGEPRAQTMAGVFRDVQADPGGGPLHDQPHRVLVQGLGFQPPIAGRSRGRPHLARVPPLAAIPDSNGPDTSPGWSHKGGLLPAMAFLVGLGAVEGDHQPVFLVGDILDGQSRQLGSPEAARETDQ